MTQAAAVEAAVREYFEALAEGRDVSALALGAAAEVDPTSPDRLEPLLEIRQLELESIEGDDAVASLDGAIGGAYELDGSSVPLRSTLSGPVTLRYDRGTWKIVDFVIDGRLRSEALVVPEGAADAEELSLQVPRLELRRSATAVSVLVENRGERRFLLTDLYRGARTLGSWTYMRVGLLEPVDIGPRGTGRTSCGWRERLVGHAELRFVLRFGEIDGRSRLISHIAVKLRPPARVEPRGDVPRCVHIRAY